MNQHIKMFFSDIKVNGFNLLITSLLVIQVGLSSFVVLKLTQLQKTNGDSSQAVAQVPDFIKNVSVDDDPVLGDINSPVTIVEFGDYQCPFCKDSVAIVKNIVDEYKGKVSFVFRDFPLDSHPFAFALAIAADCANEQGFFWEAHDYIYENQSTFIDEDSINSISNAIPLDKKMFSNCLSQKEYSDEVLNDIKDGKEYQVTGVPTFFVNGHRVIGGDYQSLKNEIDLLLK